MDETFCQKIAASYCAHILIALEVADHSAPLRDFVDNWYAYTIRTGHLTSKGRPIWFNKPSAVTHQAALSQMHYVSFEASKTLTHARENRLGYLDLRKSKDNSIRLMVDHCVPISVLWKMMLQNPSIRSGEAINDFLGQFYRVGVLSYAEDLRLNDLGLQKKMPDDWDGVDVFARYKKAAIKV